MGLKFDSAKDLFYEKINGDKRVHQHRAEARIVDLTERIVLYIDQANRVNQIVERNNKLITLTSALRGAIYEIEDDNLRGSLETLCGKLSKVVAEFQKERLKPIVPDFEDVAKIAHFVGLEQTLFKNPLNTMVKVAKRTYYDCKKDGDLDTFLLDDNTIDIVLTLCGNKPLDERKRSLDLLLNEAFKYVDRMNSLLRLADMREKIRYYYRDETWNMAWNVKANWPSSPDWEITRFSRKETKTLMSYFRKLAEVNGYLFRTLYLVSLRATDFSDPESEVEALYEMMLKQYRHNGFIGHYHMRPFYNPASTK